MVFFSSGLSVHFYVSTLYTQCILCVSRCVVGLPPCSRCVVVRLVLLWYHRFTLPHWQILSSNMRQIILLVAHDIGHVT